MYNSIQNQTVVGSRRGGSKAPQNITTENAHCGAHNVFKRGSAQMGPLWYTVRNSGVDHLGDQIVSTMCVSLVIIVRRSSLFFI